jgi:hypothetical protein
VVAKGGDAVTEGEVQGEEASDEKPSMRPFKQRIDFRPPHFTIWGAVQVPEGYFGIIRIVSCAQNFRALTRHVEYLEREKGRQISKDTTRFSIRNRLFVDITLCRWAQTLRSSAPAGRRGPNMRLPSASQWAHLERGVPLAFFSSMRQDRIGVKARPSPIPFPAVLVQSCHPPNHKQCAPGLHKMMPGQCC